MTSPSRAEGSYRAEPGTADGNAVRFGVGRRAALTTLAMALVLTGACRPTPRPTLPRTVLPAPAATGPATRADLVSGAAIYQDHCAACHGPGGEGGGPAAAALEPPPPDFTDWSATADATALDYYLAITDGVPGTAMLRWDHALSPEERWDVALHLWLMPFDQDALVSVARRLEADCASCHGEPGTPPLAQPGWTTASRQGLMDLFIEAHPDFAGRLSEENASALPGGLVLRLTTDPTGWPQRQPSR